MQREREYEREHQRLLDARYQQGWGNTWSLTYDGTIPWVSTGTASNVTFNNAWATAADTVSYTYTSTTGIQYPVVVHTWPAYPPPEPRVLTPQEIQRDEERRRRAAERWQQHVLEREQATIAAQAVATLVEERSKALLYMVLNAEQRAMLEREDKFRVVSNKGNVFEIVRGRMHNVFKLDMQGNRIQEWCVLPPGDLHVHDVMVAQKLWLETDEDATYREANVWDKATGRMINTGLTQFRHGENTLYLPQRAA